MRRADERLGIVGFLVRRPEFVALVGNASAQEVPILPLLVYAGWASGEAAVGVPKDELPSGAATRNTAAIPQKAS